MNDLPDRSIMFPPENSQDEFTIGGYVFNATCWACPEQYDVYSENDLDQEHIRAYVRLRYGKLYAVCPDVGGTIVYMHHFPDDWKGDFDNNEERIKYLTEIANEIGVYWNEATTGQ